MKKYAIFLFLFLLALSFAFSLEQSPISPGRPMVEMLNELLEIDTQRNQYLAILEENNRNQSLELEEQNNTVMKLLQELDDRESSLVRQIALSQNLGNLIDDQAKYTKKLEHSLIGWQVATGVSVSISVGLVIALLVR